MDTALRRSNRGSLYLMLGVVTWGGCALPTRPAATTTSLPTGTSAMVTTQAVKPAASDDSEASAARSRPAARPNSLVGKVVRHLGSWRPARSASRPRSTGDAPGKAATPVGPESPAAPIDDAVRTSRHTPTPSRPVILRAQSGKDDDEEEDEDGEDDEDEDEDEDEVGGGMSTGSVGAPGFTDGVRLSQVSDDRPGAAPGRRGGGAGAMGDDEEDQEDTNLDRPRAEKRGEGGAPTRSEEEEDEEHEEEEFKSDLLEKALGLEESPIGVFGWLQASFTGNPASPHDSENFGVIPNSIANRFLFQQLYFVVEKLPKREDAFDWGFRVDNLFGTDWQQFHVVGFFDNAFRPNHFGYSLMQAYAEVHLPVLTPGGVDVKGGQFYSLPGYEDVAAPGRPLNSTSYMFDFSNPFTNLGLMTIWHVTDRFNVYNGAVNGSTRWFDKSYRWGYSGALSWDSKDDATSLTFTYNLGPNQFPRYFPANFYDVQVPSGVVSPPFLARRRNLSYDANNEALFTTVLTHEWTEDFTTIIQADQGFETNIPDLGPGGTVGNGSWYGVAGWSLYELTDTLTGVYRAEWFRDVHGSRSGFNDTFYEMTLGAIYKPVTWFWLRPEIRFDWATGEPPYDDEKKKTQLTLGFDAIFLF